MIFTVRKQFYSANLTMQNKRNAKKINKMNKFPHTRNEKINNLIRFRKVSNVSVNSEANEKRQAAALPFKLDS